MRRTTGLAGESHGLSDLVDLYRRLGAVDTLRRVVGSAAFLSGPICPAVARPMVWLNHPFLAAALRGLLRGRRVLVLGSGPSANDLETVPDDVVVLTCKAGPKILVDKGLCRDIDLYYYPSFRVDPAGRERRRLLASIVGQSRIDCLVCEDLMTLIDVAPLKARYSRLLMDFTANQLLLRRLIAPATVRQIRGRAFCPWTSTGVRLVQYAAYFGAREIYMIGVDLGQHGYATGEAARPWHHEDIDDNFLRVISRRCAHVYSLSEHSPVARHFAVRYWSATPR